MLRTTSCLLLATGLTLSACSTPETPSMHDTQDAQPVTWPLPPGAVLEQAGSVTPDPIEDDALPHGSLAPDNATPADRVPTIVDRGYVLVGVNQSQNLLSFRDPVTGQLQGFEVDIAREIARDIFGDPDRVEFRYVDASDFQEALDTGRVDMVLRSMSITAARQQHMAFSAPYLATSKQLLALTQSGVDSVRDLNGRTVCVANMSTALDRARQVATGANIIKVRNWADCLVALQQHQADAILADDAILAGIAAQDPYATLVGNNLSRENYGVVFPLPAEKPAAAGGIRQVNYTLARISRDGTWQKIYNRWLGPYQVSAGPPPPVYDN
ncbi:hypothetical protein CAQU_11265 [Corynebacterium aquilae DSM 44791]|uniref:Solute-binding protein family 3/N-terminal domain-containing protein n=1 Tax=Corynebacterium aquilae DSM 44791 TaxID=1431546 RepID=A0A1L7CI89_9CORY|nr:hypothetical protein CAQU_11265 [Corynebacterium aquilae DSM 44791]